MSESLNTSASLNEENVWVFIIKRQLDFRIKKILFEEDYYGR